MLKLIVILSISILITLAFCFLIYKILLIVLNKYKYSKNLHRYNARIDIINSGQDKNDIIFLKQILPDKLSVKYDNLKSNTILFIAKEEWQKAQIKFKAKGDGYITVSIMGAFIPDAEGNAKKILIDYKNVILNSEPIFTNTKTLWHDEREKSIFQAIDDEVYTIEFEYKKHED